MKILELDGFNMIERPHEDFYIDEWDDEYDFGMPDHDDYENEGWYEDDYDHLDNLDEFEEEF